MIIRHVKNPKWKPVRRRILEEGICTPQSLQVDIPMTCNGTDYILRVQPEKGRRIIALQATEAVLSEQTGRREFYLVENNGLLTALVELLIHQTPYDPE